MKKDQIKFTKRKLGLWAAMLVSAGVLMNTGRVQASSAPNYDYNVVTDAEEKVNPTDKISVPRKKLPFIFRQELTTLTRLFGCIPIPT